MQRQEFLGSMRELDWIEGSNILTEYRWSQDRTERYAEIAAEFVRLKVDVVLARADEVIE